jgi:hypothetical protein
VTEYPQADPATNVVNFRARLSRSNVDLSLIVDNLNRQRASVPDYIKIHNPHGDLFPNGSMVGWKHRNQEREFLRKLYHRRR